MSATKPANRTEFRNFCLRKLGEPVIRVNVAPEQVEDCIDQAIEYFQREHYDGQYEMMLPLTVTEKVKEQGYFDIDDTIISVTRVLELTGTGMGGSSPDAMLTFQWQMMAGAARILQGGMGGMCNNGMTQYVNYLQNRDLLKWMLGGQHTPMGFSRHTDRLYIFGNDSNLNVGSIVVCDVRRVLVPDEFPQVWNDPFLKKYCTALIKQQWGNNLRKLRNVPLAGGVMLQGEEILQEAVEEIRELEENMQLEWQEPPMPMVG